ncbi:MAG: IS1595 family transposase [Thiotrichales bacterium]
MPRRGSGRECCLSGLSFRWKSGVGSVCALLAAVSLTEEDRPLRVRLTPAPGFTLQAVAAWAKDHLAPGNAVFSDGWACFGAVTAVGCAHHPTVMAGRKPREVPEFQWINTVLDNLKTSLSGCCHAFDFRKYAARYLAAFCYRFNRRIDRRTLHQRLLVATASSPPQPLRSIRLADVLC